MLVPVCVIVRTLLHVQNNPLVSSGANAPGMPAAPRTAASPTGGGSGRHAATQEQDISE